MSVTIFSSDAGCFGAGIVSSFHVDAVTPQPVFGAFTGDPYNLLVQFLVDLPSGCTINSAKLRLYTSTGTGSAGSAFYAPTLRAVDLDDATWTTSYATASTRPLTSAVTSGTDELHLGGITEWDVTALLQEIVDRSGFNGGYVIFQNVTNYPLGGDIQYLPDDAASDPNHRPTLVIKASGTADAVADDDGSWGSTGAVIQGDNYLQVRNHLSTGPASTDAGVRFPGGIPKNAIIESASLMFIPPPVGGSSNSDLPCTIQIYAIYLDDVPTFPTTASAANALAAFLTPHSVSHLVPGTILFSTFSVDFKAVIEDLVARAGWSVKSHVMIYVSDLTGDTVFKPASLESGSPVRLSVDWNTESDDGGGSGGQVGVNGSFFLMLFERRRRIAHDGK